MKRLILCALLAIVLNACAAGVGIPVPGTLYSNVVVPREGVASGNAMKVGEAVCESVLGLVSTGDCSIEAAKRNGKIVSVNHVDMKTKNILGVYAEYTTQVYGN